MSRLSLATSRHDPDWDLDGQGARRTRHQRKFVRWGVSAVAVIVLAILVTRLPAIDPTFLATPAGRPILAAAILSLLAATVLLGLVRMRRASHN